MKKNNTQKADNKKNSNVSAQNQNEKKNKNGKQESKTSMDYPAWTSPVHLEEKDHKDLKRFYELYKEGKFEVALQFTLNFDTIVREEIPTDIWEEIGGVVISTKEDETKEESENQTEEVMEQENIEKITTEDEERSLEQQENKNDVESIEPILNKQNSAVVPEGKPVLFLLKHGFLLRDSNIFTLNNVHFDERAVFSEVKLSAKSELEELILQYHSTIFGENNVVIDNTKCSNEYFPDMFLVDFSDRVKPRIYIIEQYLQGNSLGLLYARITHFIASLSNKKYQNDFLSELNNVINADDKVKEELKERLNEEQDIAGLLSELIDNKPAILLLKDNENVTLDLMQSVYVHTWGKMLRQILIRKYFGEDETVYEVNPAFADIWKNERQKAEDAVIITENDHLCELPDRIRNIYRSIKSALLETDNSLEFNVKKHYISIKKEKNLAFIQLKRKNVDIVVMHPENETRELIQYHKIKSLVPSVQKFWNGECCTVIVENSDNLEEIIGLLKIVVLNVK